MSRIGKRILQIPEGINVEFKDKILKVSGPLGELTQVISPKVELIISDGKIEVKRNGNERALKMIHGTMNSLINNMLIGVGKGYSKELLISGVGYNVIMNENKLTFSLGFSHKIILEIPKTLKIELKKPTHIKIDGFDKQLVGQFASKIRLLKKPEPYGGKGIRYIDEKIIRKSGKASSK
ncbi:MAG: 50S ribosomal protein L6 [Candidatus Hepatoplasma vulgare]|nr:MAG: 50S ribosomal protein L6 [Candidatus Hepatoplasma sp.]